MVANHARSVQRPVMHCHTSREGSTRAIYEDCRGRGTWSMKNWREERIPVILRCAAPWRTSALTQYA
eukprot:2041656-Rhodomonas_salina.3